MWCPAECDVQGSGLLTEEQSLLSDMVQMFMQIQPEAKFPEPEGWRRNFYLIFTDIRPLPIPGVQEQIDANNIPQPRFVRDHFIVSHQIERMKDTIESQTCHTDPNNHVIDLAIVEETRNSLQLLEQKHANQRQQISVLEKFSNVALDSQLRPEGLIYTCGCYFDSVLTCCILMNIVCMCTLHHNQSADWENFLWAQNLVFNVLFSGEMTIKLIGLGICPYWRSPFDAFDGCIVLISWVFVFVDGGAIAGTIRIGRVFKVVKRAQKLQNLMSTLVQTLPSITNVFMVLLLVFFIFSVIAVELFGRIRYGFGLNVVANFGTWSASMHTLWRAALGNFREAMYDSMVSTKKPGFLFI